MHTPQHTWCNTLQHTLLLRSVGQPSSVLQLSVVFVRVHLGIVCMPFICTCDHQQRHQQVESTPTTVAVSIALLMALHRPTAARQMLCLCFPTTESDCCVELCRTCHKPAVHVPSCHFAASALLLSGCLVSMCGSCHACFRAQPSTESVLYGCNCSRSCCAVREALSAACTGPHLVPASFYHMA